MQKKHTPTAEDILKNIDDLQICVSGNQFCITKHPKTKDYKVILTGSLAETKEGTEKLLGKILEGFILGGKKIMENKNEYLFNVSGTFIFTEDFIEVVIQRLEENGSIYTKDLIRSLEIAA